MWAAIAASAVMSQQYATSSLYEAATSIAIEYHLNKDHFLATLKCESGFEFDAIGDDGASIGIAQIDLKYHPDVDYSEAMNPDWAMIWMATEWSRGYAHEWSCWRRLYG